MYFKERWVCCDLNASLWLPKPQGYQATPQTQISATWKTTNKEENIDSVSIINLLFLFEIFEVIVELFIFLS